MKIKKYQAASISEAMEQIRMELGKDAVILNSKVVFSGGILGFFKKKRIEVIAAADQESQQIPVRKEKQGKPVAGQTSKRQPLPENVRQEKVDKPADRKQDTEIKQAKENEILKELDELKRLVGSMALSKETPMPAPIAEIVAHLKSHGVNEAAVQEVKQNLSSGLGEKEMNHYEAISITSGLLAAMLPAKAAGMPEKKFINVVGPTGVGKTTTLAKLAAASSLKHHKKVAFITTDTYRIAAIEQLKTYANILNVPIEVAYNVEDFKKACEQFSHYDHVFIDTAGRNFRNKEYVEDLKSIISFNDEMETYLVLSLTSKQQDMEAIYRQFSSLPVSYFIFTKLDETSSYGAMFNMAVTYRTNIAFATNGQNVPDDLIEASPQKIVRLIMGDLLNERSS